MGPASQVGVVSSIKIAAKAVLKCTMNTVKVVVEVSIKAAEVMIATARTILKLTMSDRRSSTSLAKYHPVPAMAPLQDIEPLPARIHTFLCTL